MEEKLPKAMTPVSKKRFKPGGSVHEGILKLYGQGRGTTEIAARFGCCVADVRRVCQHFKACGMM